jgi:hypothetical protein
MRETRDSATEVFDYGSRMCEEDVDDALGGMAVPHRRYGSLLAASG